jgi:hypothetical protein
VVVAVGASVMLPEASELVVSVRVEEPAVAVIVTEVAFTACQVKVTLCPTSMAAALAEKTSDGGSDLLTPLQPDSDNNATGSEAQVTQRRMLFLIVDSLHCPPQERATFRCGCWIPSWSNSAETNQ